jgi:hypothetical protein
MPPLRQLSTPMAIDEGLNLEAGLARNLNPVAAIA